MHQFETMRERRERGSDSETERENKCQSYQNKSVIAHVRSIVFLKATSVEDSVANKQAFLLIADRDEESTHHLPSARRRSWLGLATASG